MRVKPRSPKKSRPSSEPSAWHRGRLMVLAAGVVLLVGALLPWAILATALSEEVQWGFEGDGLVTGIIGLILMAIAWRARRATGRRTSLAATGLGFLAALIVLLTMTRLNNVAALTGDATEGRFGPGLYVSALGAGLAVYGGMRPTPRDAPDEARPDA